MWINLIILAISSSIDSLGIGITYGIRGTSISFFGKLILFAISFIITMLSIILGNIIKHILPEFIIPIIGSSILIFMGIFICFQSLTQETISFDFDSSNNIDPKEAFFLSLALSLDSFCIGIGSTIIGISNMLFPFAIASFQLLFLSLGIILGKRIINFSNFSDNVWSIISGILLILIGIIKL